LFESFAEIALEVMLLISVVCVFDEGLAFPLAFRVEGGAKAAPVLLQSAFLVQCHLEAGICSFPKNSLKHKGLIVLEETIDSSLLLTSLTDSCKCNRTRQIALGLINKGNIDNSTRLFPNLHPVNDKPIFLIFEIFQSLLSILQINAHLFGFKILIQNLILSISFDFW
jgi:hypothetical protein